MRVSGALGGGGARAVGPNPLRMTRRAPSSSAPACLAGCGARSEPGTTAAGPSTTVDTAAVATACGDLRARLQGISGTRGVRDPQPPRSKSTKWSAKWTSPARNRSRRTTASKPSCAEPAPRSVDRSASRGSRRFRRYARLLSEAPPSAKEAIHIQVRLLALDDAEVKACAAAGARATAARLARDAQSSKDSSCIRERRRRTAFVCIWETRDSVTPSTSPISLSVRFS